MRSSSSGPHTGRKSHQAHAPSPGAREVATLDGPIDDLERLDPHASRRLVERRGLHGIAGGGRANDSRDSTTF